MQRNAALTIAAKEFTEHVHSRRFQLALGLATLLLVTSVVTLSVTYNEDMEAFELQQEQRTQGESFGGFNRITAEVADVVDRPNPLSVFAAGSDATGREAASGGVGFAMIGPSPAGGGTASGGSDSPTNQRFESLDLVFVAVVVMSFMAVLFSYDAISGERERGTLKLMMTNPVPRDQILFGKMLGGMASLLVAFGAAVLVALVVFQFMDIRLTFGEWGRLAMILVLFVPLASAFYLLGLAVSSLARRSGTSLLALLLVWLVLVFGAGNVAAAAAKGTADVTTDADLMRAFDVLEEERRSLAQPLENEMFQFYEQPVVNGTRDPAAQARIDELSAQLTEINQEIQEQRDALVTRASRELESQLLLAERLALVSPAEAFRTLTGTLAGSDYWTYKEQREEADLYLREVEREREAWQEQNPDDFSQPSNVRVSWSTSTGTRIIGGSGDGFEPPEFLYDEASVGQALGSGRSAGALFVLLAYNLLAFGGAYVAFLRYDVR